MAHQNYNSRPRGPAPRGYQQQQYSHPAYAQQQYYPHAAAYQQPRSYAYYGGYAPQQPYAAYAGYQQQPRGYTAGAYQRPAHLNQQPTPAKAATTFVPRKKNILVISKPDGTRVNNTAPAASSDAATQPTKEPIATESAAKSTTTPEAAAEPATQDAAPTDAAPTKLEAAVNPPPEVKAEKPTPKPVEIAKPPTPPAEEKPAPAAEEKPAPAAEEKPAAKAEAPQPAKPASLKIEVEERSQTAKDKTPPKAELAAVQTNDLDAWEDANIPTPGGIKNAPTSDDKMYSFDQLMKIRESCNLEPLDSWPAYDIINVASTPRGRSSPRGGPRQRRNYQDPRYDQRHNQMPRQWARGQKPVPRPSPREPVRPQVKLHKTKNKWSRDKHEMAKAKNHLDSVKKAANSILNKLSVDNFERLLPKFLELEIQTKLQFEAVTEIIFDKALRMPTYCFLYARLCGEVNQKAQMFCDNIVKIVEEEEEGRKVYYYDVGDDERTDGVEGPFDESDTALRNGTKVCTFKRVLLNQCQRVFESHSSWEEAFKNAKDPSLSALEQKRALEEAEETRFKVKQRSLGIVQFVAHLFLNQLLSEKRVHVCMSELLQRVEKELNQTPPVTEGVEVFAKIITEVGQTIDNGHNKGMIHIYMQNLQKISKTKGLDSRTKFMIMDVIDLREKFNWVPRRKKAKMVTKAQFKKEAEAEMRANNRKNQRRPNNGGGNNRRHNDRHNNDRGGRRGFR